MNLFRRLALIVSCVAIVALTFNSCKDDEDGTPVTGVSLNTTDITLAVGETKTLTATVSPESADNKNVTWSSSQPTFASVDGGTITALAAGETMVTVTTVDGGFTATCVVTVVSESEKYLTVSPRGEYLLFSRDGTKTYLVLEDGSQSEITPVFTVETNADSWSVETVSDWCHVAKDEINNTITISADANTEDTMSRSATVIVSAEGADTIEIGVVQEQATLLDIIPSIAALTFSASGKTLYNGDEKISPEFLVETSADTWSVSSSQSWCTVIREDDDLDMFTIYAAENTSTTSSPQDATITVKANEAEYSFTVSQRKVEYDVYLAGYTAVGTITTAIFWKNGEQVSLTDGTNPAQGLSIFVDDNDHVYVSGHEKVGNYHVPKYWKDNASGEVMLTKDDDARDSYARAIYVSDGVVYVAGDVKQNVSGYPSIPQYWTDNNPTILPTSNRTTGSGYAYDIYVENGTVYTAGYYAAPSSVSHAVYWENQTEHILNTMGTGYARGIYVYDGMPYIGGTIMANYLTSVYYWIGDTQYTVEVAVTGVSYEINDICVADGDVYVCGTDTRIVSGAGLSTATYWRDTQRVTLGDGVTNSYAKGICVIGDNVYVSGYETGETYSTPCYWINGEKIELTHDGTGSGAANDIFVKMKE